MAIGPTAPAAPTDASSSARAIVADAMHGYFVARHARVADFVDRHFSLRGTLRLHQAAIGWDIARAPLNLTMAAPQAGLFAAASLARRLGATRLHRSLSGKRLLLTTAVGRELTWLIHAELLELPFRDGKREAKRDALAEAILTDFRVDAAMAPVLREIARRGDDPALRLQLEQALTHYAGSRGAAAEITTSLMTMATGAAALNKLTPGAMSLGPALAASLAQHSAIASFSLGSGLGTLWYGMFPASPSLGLLVGTTGGLMAVATVAAAFAGVIADPVQRRLGLHQRRLHRMLDALERQMRDPSSEGFAVHDHYVARLLDLFDLLGALYRVAAR